MGKKHRMGDEGTTWPGYSADGRGDAWSGYGWSAWSRAAAGGSGGAWWHSDPSASWQSSRPAAALAPTAADSSETKKDLPIHEIDQ